MRSHPYITILLAAGCLAGCGGSGSPPAAIPPASLKVDIHSFEFNPPAVHVKRGGKITWTNSDAAAHTATADDRSFDTQTVDHSQSRTVVFKTAGTLAYHCDFHPFMKGTVVVR